MFDFAQPSDIPLNFDVIGRVRNHHTGEFAIHQGRDNGMVARIPADDFVGAGPINIPGSAATRNHGRIRQEIILRTTRLLRPVVCDHMVDFGYREPGDRQLKAGIKAHERL